MLLQYYLKGLLFSAVMMLGLSALYLFAYLVRNPNKSKRERRNRILDVVLINLLTIPILSFAVLGLLIILKVRAL